MCTNCHRLLNEILVRFANNALWQADLVELVLKEDWQTYVKNLDALILKACKLTDV